MKTIQPDGIWRSEPFGFGEHGEGNWCVACYRKDGQGVSRIIAAGRYGFAEIFLSEQEASVRADEINTSGYPPPLASRESGVVLDHAEQTQADRNSDP